MEKVKRLFLDKIFYSPDGCWYWTGYELKGYGGFKFQNKTMQAHRVSHLLFKGNIPQGLQVCHSCDNPLCVNPDHLWLGTNSDNMQDAIRKGRKIVSEETRKKISLAGLGRKFSAMHRKRLSESVSKAKRLKYANI